MAEVVHTGQWLPGGKTAVDLLGVDHGAEVTLIIEDMKPGGGPRLHKHPYPEVWVVISGTGDFTAGDKVLQATTGDVVYVEPELPHKFVATGSEPLRMVCIHNAPSFTTVWLE
jgi:mannose-6-phosphate isomerase-like protein (cupin superfamily)